jgi:periplasmic copper chaperone A
MKQTTFLRRFGASIFLAIFAMTTAPVAVYAADSVRITNAWVRGTVFGQRGSGAYMNIQSDAPARILSAASPAADNVEIHNMKMENGIMRMSPVKSIALEAGKPLRFMPGSYHVMLMGLKDQLKKGDTVPITITLEYVDKKVRQVRVNAEVRDVTGHAH